MLTRKTSLRTPESEKKCSYLTESSLQKHLQSFKTELKNEIAEIITNELKREIAEQVSVALSGVVETLNKKIENQQREIDELRGCIVRSEKDKLHVARRELAPNLVIREVPEAENEMRAETEEKVRSLLEKMEVADHSGLVRVERIGKRLEDKTSRIIRVVTKSVQERNNILAQVF